MATVGTLELARGAYVHRNATVIHAGQKLVDLGLGGVAVVDDDRRVVGLLTVDRLIRSLFPPYLAELKHTAFVGDALDALARRMDEASGESVQQHMTNAQTLSANDSTLHAAELFLHSKAGVLVIVEAERFVGVLDRVGFARALLAQAHEASG